MREAAARSLGRFPDLPSDAQLRLVTALTDTAPLVRRSAALSLATASLEPQTVLRIMALFDQEDLHDRAVLSMALLGGSTERPSASLIHDALEGDGDVRQAAVAALGELGHDEAIAILHDRLQHDVSSTVRAEAAYRLHFLSSDKVTTDLVAASRVDASAQVRRWAREGLPESERLNKPDERADRRP